MWTWVLSIIGVLVTLLLIFIALVIFYSSRLLKKRSKDLYLTPISANTEANQKVIDLAGRPVLEIELKFFQEYFFNPLDYTSDADKAMQSLQDFINNTYKDQKVTADENIKIIKILAEFLVILNSTLYSKN